MSKQIQNPNFKNNHHRFFIDPDNIQGDFFITKNKDLINQIKNVFRLHGHDFNGDKEGDHILVLDGTGWEYEFELEEVSNKNIDGCLVEKKFYEKDNKKIGLFCSLLKGDHFEMVLEKCTELGTDLFQPVVYERSVIREISKGKMERYRKIIKEATEQSGRLDLPEIFEPVNLKEAIKKTKNAFNLVSAIKVGKNILDIKFKGKDINIFIGPEGDFSEKEINIMRKENFLFFNLGNNVLRSETAAIVSCGIIAQFML